MDRICRSATYPAEVASVGRRPKSIAAAADEVDDLQAVAGVELELVPVGALGDLVIEFDGDAVAFKIHCRDEISDGGLRLKTGELA